MTFGTTSRAWSTCALVLNRPKENRKPRRAPSPLGSIALSTCEASSDPVRQAEPAEQQIRCRSNKRRAAGDSIPSNEKLDVFGIRAAPAPFTAAPFTVSRIAFSNRSRIERTCVFPSDKYWDALSAAFPRPTIDATFSVPPHHGNDRRFRANRRLQLGKIDISIPIHTEKRHPAAAFREVLARVQHGAVLNRACHDMSAT